MSHDIVRDAREDREDAEKWRHRADWQLIETAPKDGTEILVCDRNAAEPSATQVHWQPGDKFGWVCWPSGYMAWLSCPNKFREFIPVMPTPTHWMPMPEVPK